MTKRDIVTRLNERLAEGVSAPCDVRLDLGTDGVIFIDCRSATASLSTADAPLVLGMSLSDCLDMMDGELDPATAFMTRKLTVLGDMAAAMQIHALISAKRKNSGNA